VIELDVERDPVFGCWLWNGRRDSDGYGVLYSGARVHLVSYAQHLGAIPRAHELDHLCRRRACCRPSHLEAVTRTQNELRKAWRHRVRRATCPRGHDTKLHGIVTPEGGVVCRECNRGQV